MKDLFSTVHITGINGWLGKGLTAYLGAEYGVNQSHIFGMDLSTPENAEQYTKGSVTSKNSCDDFLKNSKNSVLFHLVGVIHPKSVNDFFDVNVQGTKNLVEAAIKNGVKKIVVVSSNSPTGASDNPDDLFDENTAYNPYMNYGKSKMEMELYLKEQSENIDIVILRPTWFYGPNQPERQTTFFKMVRDGRFPIVGPGENKRSMTYIDNLCQGLCLAAVKPTSSADIFWISDKTPYSMNTILETVQKALVNNNISVKNNTFKLPNFVGSVAECVDSSLQKIGIYQQKIHVLSEMNKTISCDVTKAESILGYAPKVSLYDGMDKSIKWCIDKGYL